MFQMYERLLDAAGQVAQFIKAGRAHQVRVWKYGTRRSGISTHVSPSGRFSAASAAGSVTAQPCTIHDSRSVRYKAGEPSGTESGSFATKDQFHVPALLPDLPELALASSIDVPGMRSAVVLHR